LSFHAFTPITRYRYPVKNNRYSLFTSLFYSHNPMLLELYSCHQARYSARPFRADVWFYVYLVGFSAIIKKSQSTSLDLLLRKGATNSLFSFFILVLAEARFTKLKSYCKVIVHPNSK
jgi:hypothetical protein